MWYEVFARRSPRDYLAHVGSVDAANEEQAKARAWLTYDEHAWREMCLVPRSAVIPVRPAAGQQIGVC
jgi:1,2-phenylacetyl-CoA epoxidase PaaB subunit